MKKHLISFASIALVLGMNQTMAQQVPTTNTAAPFAASELIYPGMSTTRAFIATEPYVLNIGGKMVSVSLLGKPRSYEFGGDVPFVNPGTLVSDPNVLQAWDPTVGAGVNLAGGQITLNGLNQRITKTNGALMVRHVAGDGLLGGTGRSSLVSYPMPPRTHVRWDMIVTFGATSGENTWNLTKYNTHPVLFWELKSPNAGTPAIEAVVDTDPDYPTTLAIKLLTRGGTSPAFVSLGQARQIPVGKPVSITIEAYLDERETAAGGKGRVKATINNVVVGDVTGPTLTLGPNVHMTNFSTYSYMDTTTVANTRAVFFQQARIMVMP